jgi:hypothetical protein
MPDPDITVVANLLGALLAANGYKSAKYIYSFVMALVGNGRSPACFANFVEVAERDTENVFLKSSLLEITQSLKGMKGPAKAPVTFPALNFAASSLQGQKVDFANYANFPPLLIVDEAFEACPTVVKIQKLVKGAVVEPISSWKREVETATKVKVEKPKGGGAEFEGKDVADALAQLEAKVAGAQTRGLEVVADETGVFARDFPNQ